ncbi:type II toxin-antitoxin system PemK/MazF family toxin [Lonepinella sp. BR2271]|uniref:type II toxin-antitoxin system PemK/MazF family toxin n=1 Tax=Lonepinella sp. BR2271 TaxID=3434550 RepID=UPI003F6DFBE4
MSIGHHRLKVGDILECDYGLLSQNINNFDGHIPPEIVKRRMVVVLNAKLQGLALVVPISSTKNISGIQNQYHIEIDSNLIQETSFYDKRQRWAKAELIQAVSRQRLFPIYHQGKRIDNRLPYTLVEQIQKAVIKAISANILLDKS